MYQRVGAFQGQTRTLAGRYSLIGLDQAATGYGSTSDRHALVLGVFSPEMGHIFPGVWPYSMVVVVMVNGSIPPHRDAPLRRGFQRYHIVLQTNENCWNYHAGEWAQLEEGGIYTMDCTKTHAAINWGAEPRVHLVIDAAAFSPVEL